MVGESTEAVGAGVGGGSSGNKMPTLEEYGTNLTKLAEEVVATLIASLEYLKQCPFQLTKRILYLSGKVGPCCWEATTNRTRYPNFGSQNKK